MVALPRWLRFGRRAPRADTGWVRTFNDTSAWWPEWLGGTRTTSSGEDVGESSALGLSAYYASLRNGAQDLAKLSRKVRKHRPEGERGSEVLPKHPIARLFRQPNPTQTWGVFAQTMQHRAMGWGNAYAEIVRDGAGVAVEMWPLHPSKVAVKLTGSALTYEYRLDGGGKAVLGARDVLHVRGMGDGIQGFSVLRFASETLGLGLAAQRHAAAFYGEGMAKRMVAFVKGPTLGAEGRKALRERIQSDKKNDPVGQRKLTIIDGMEVDLKDVGIPPDEAQFLESREFSVEDVARWFRMSLAKLQYFKRAQGWSSLDALNTDYATDFLMPWVTTWEEECWSKLLTDEEKDSGHFVKFNLNTLMRGDSTTRVAYYAAGIKDGWLSQNDVRELEDMDPIKDEAADVYRTQAQMVPLSMPEDDKPDPEPPPATMTFAPPPVGVEQPEDDEADPEDPPEGDAMAAFTSAAERLRPSVEAVARRFVRVEVEAATRALTKRSGNKVAFAQWESGFYADHAESVAESLALAGMSLEALAAHFGVSGVGAGAALLAVVPEYRKAVTIESDESGRVAVMLGCAWAALVGNVTVKEAPRA